MTVSQWSQATKTLPVHKLHGTVVNAGERARTIRVRVTKLQWNKRVNKHFKIHAHYLVRDPNRSTRIGDTVLIRGNWRVAKRVKHLLLGITQPFGTPLASRPAVPTLAELVQEKLAKKERTDERQALRGRPAALKRVERRKQLVELEREKVEASEKVGGMSEGQLGGFQGSDLGRAHVAWASRGWGAEPSNAELLKRVRKVVGKAYQIGAWPRWDAEMLKLQQLTTLMALLKRSQVLSTSSSSSSSQAKFLASAHAAYKAALTEEITTVSSALSSSHGKQSFTAAEKILRRIASENHALLPRLFSTQWVSTTLPVGLEQAETAAPLILGRTQSLLRTAAQEQGVGISLQDRMAQLHISDAPSSNYSFLHTST